MSSLSSRSSFLIEDSYSESQSSCYSDFKNFVPAIIKVNPALSKKTVAPLPVEYLLSMPVKNFEPCKSHFAKLCNDLEDEDDKDSDYGNSDDYFSEYYDEGERFQVD